MAIATIPRKEGEGAKTNLSTKRAPTCENDRISSQNENAGGASGAEEPPSKRPLEAHPVINHLDQRFRWDERLHRKQDFTRIYKEGRRFSFSGLSAWILKRQEGETFQKPRLGLAIPKAYGNAVTRNRLKRLIREVFRLNKEKLPPGVDMVFSARSTMAKPRYQSVEPIILKLWTLAGLQPPSRAS
jgi:ribonuclease P protein component